MKKEIMALLFISVHICAKKVFENTINFKNYLFELKIQMIIFSFSSLVNK